MLHKEIFKVSETTRKSNKGKSHEKSDSGFGRCHIPNECDFIYDSVVELYPINTMKVRDCDIPSTSTAKKLQNTSQSEWTKHIHSVNVALQNLQLNFAKILDTIHQEMDAENVADIISNDSQDETVDKKNVKCKKELILTRPNFEIMELLPSKTKIVGNTCQTSSGLDQTEKIKKPYKICRTLRHTKIVEKPNSEYILDALKSAEEVIDSIKDALMCHRAKSRDCSESNSKSLRTIPITPLDGLNSLNTIQLIEGKRNAISKIDLALKNLNVDSSELAEKEHLKTKSQPSEHESHKECPKCIEKFMNVLDIGPKGYDSENIFRVLKQKNIKCDEEMQKVSNEEFIPKKSQSKEKDGVSSDSRQFELKALKEKYATIIENNNYTRNNTENKSSPGSSTLDKTLTLEEAFGISSSYTDEGNTSNIKTKVKSAFVKAHDPFSKKTDTWVRDHILQRNLRQTNEKNEKFLMKEVTENPYAVKDDLMYIDNQIHCHKLVWKSIFEDYF